MSCGTHNVGDKGQRYVLQGLNYPIEGKWSDIGYAENKEDLEKAETAILKAPSIRDTRIIDRESFVQNDPAN